MAGGGHGANASLGAKGPSCCNAGDAHGADAEAITGCSRESDGGPVRPAASWYQRHCQYLKIGAGACGCDACHFGSSGLEGPDDVSSEVGAVASVDGDAADNCSSHLKLRHSTMKSVRKAIEGHLQNKWTTTKDNRSLNERVGHRSHYLTDIDSDHKVKCYDDVPPQMPPYCTSCN